MKTKTHSKMELLIFIGGLILGATIMNIYILNNSGTTTLEYSKSSHAFISVLGITEAQKPYLKVNINYSCEAIKEASKKCIIEEKVDAYRKSINETTISIENKYETPMSFIGNNQCIVIKK